MRFTCTLSLLGKVDVGRASNGISPSYHNFEILSFLVVFCSLSTLVEAVKSTTQVSIIDAIDNGRPNFHKGHKRDKGNDDTEPFVSTFYIAYSGPEKKFDVNDANAVAFLQNSV
jgi:hypothetical protein